MAKSSKTAITMDDVMTRAEAKEKLGISDPTFYKKVKEGQIRCVGYLTIKPQVKLYLKKDVEALLMPITFLPNLTL